MLYTIVSNSSNEILDRKDAFLPKTVLIHNYLRCWSSDIQHFPG